MKWLFYALVALIVSVVIGLFALPDPGYILIGYGKYSVETTLVMLIAGLIISYFLIRGLIAILHVPKKVQGWNHERLVLKDIKRLDKGMSQLIEGNASNAERDLRRLKSTRGKPLISYIAAARAAQQQGSIERRDEYLALAHKDLPGSSVAIELSKAELQIADSQYELALNTLTGLRAKAPQHAQVLKLLVAIYRQTGDWTRLRELLPEIKKRKILDAAEYQQLSADSVGALLEVAASESDAPAELQSFWKSLSKAEKQEPVLIAQFAEKLIRSAADAEAEQIISSTLKSRWDSRLAALYGHLSGGDESKQLATAESWLNNHPEDPRLLLTNARLSIRNQLWGKARSYIEASISILPTPEAYQLLGVLSEKTDNETLALEAYRQGMKLIAAPDGDLAIEGEVKRLDNSS
ncbi:MAG: heme biosynthesis HemY N-terminal domain-containing protein [Gammaproteobacteria bacterium]